MSWILLMAVTALVAILVSAEPQPQAPGDSTPIPIISQSDTVNPDGSFNFGFETGNGIKIEESGQLKPNPNAKPGDEDQTFQVLSGSVSYTAPDGTPINLKYVADENGFQPSGDHLPTPPPIPEEILKSLVSSSQNDQGAAPQS